MRIAVYTNIFPPNNGGSGLVARLLAAEYARAGHMVTVLTETEGDNSACFPFRLIRRPSLRALIESLRLAEVVQIHGPSAKSVFASRISARPTLLTHHQVPGKDLRSFRDLALTLGLTHSTPSAAVARALPAHLKPIIIRNPYDTAAFPAEVFASECRADFAFVGRLTASKGAEDIISAFARAQLPSSSRLHIVGDGELKSPLIDLAAAEGITAQTIFHGAIPHPELFSFLRNIHTLVVPSRCSEAFGVVVLEGLAAGCRVIVSDTGGLPESGGGHVDIFESGNVAQLACLLKGRQKKHDNAVLNEYLAQHHPHVIGQSYLKLLSKLTNKESV